LQKFQFCSEQERNQNNLSDIPGVRSSGEKLIILYTCKICDVRSAKRISKHGYEKGCVVVQCPGCKSLHLIADRIGIFENPGWDIKTILEGKHENQVKVIKDESDVFELSLSDILGSDYKEK
jgi:protein import protein ZIM17